MAPTALVLILNATLSSNGDLTLIPAMILVKTISVDLQQTLRKKPELFNSSLMLQDAGKLDMYRSKPVFPIGSMALSPILMRSQSELKNLIILDKIMKIFYNK
jgi:hypothetical protein